MFGFLDDLFDENENNDDKRRSTMNTLVYLALLNQLNTHF